MEEYGTDGEQMHLICHSNNNNNNNNNKHKLFIILKKMYVMGEVR